MNVNAEMSKNCVEAAGHIGKKYGIKQITGIILDENAELNFHTQCILCDQTTEAPWVQFLNNMALRSTCSACGATVTYNRPTTAVETPAEDAEDGSGGEDSDIGSLTPPVTEPADSLPATQPEPTVEAPAAKPLDEKETSPKSAADKKPKSMFVNGILRHVYERYEPLIGEVIKGQTITGITKKSRGILYRLQCNECGRENLASCDQIVDHPESTKACRCVFGKYGIKKPSPGDMMYGFKVVDIAYEMDSDDLHDIPERRAWMVTIECPDCGRQHYIAVDRLAETKPKCVCKMPPNAVGMYHHGITTAYSTVQAVEIPSSDDEDPSLPGLRIDPLLTTPKYVGEVLVLDVSSDPIQSAKLAQQERTAGQSRKPEEKESTTKAEPVQPSSPAKLSHPDIKTKYVRGSEHIVLDTPELKHLYSIYRSMVSRAKSAGDDIILSWYDDALPTIENIEGFKKFVTWSIDHGYTRQLSNSGVNMTKLLRRDLTLGYDTNNCYWGLLGAC